MWANNPLIKDWIARGFVVEAPQVKQQQRTAQATKTVMAMNGPGMTTIPRGTGMMPGREAALSNAPASDTQFNQPPSFKR